MWNGRPLLVSDYPIPEAASIWSSINDRRTSWPHVGTIGKAKGDGAGSVNNGGSLLVCDPKA